MYAICFLFFAPPSKISTNLYCKFFIVFVLSLLWATWHFLNFLAVTHLSISADLFKKPCMERQWVQVEIHAIQQWKQKFSNFLPSLVSIHIVFERLYVMQDLACVRGFCAQNSKNTLFLASQEYLPPPPPTIGLSHGGLSNFRSEAAKNTPAPPGLELLMENLATLGVRLPRIPPPPPDWNCAGVWRLIAVSPTDTI